MKALQTFYRRGAEDADRRIAALLALPASGVTDRYLQSSAIVRGIDRITELLRSSLSDSATGRAAAAARAAWQRAQWVERYFAIGLMLIVAVSVHVVASVMRGDRPGWAGWIIPALTAVFAVVVLIASRLMASSK